MKQLWSCIKPYRGYVALAITFMIVDVFSEVLQPTLMANIIGQGIESGDVSYIVRTGVLMIVVSALALVAGFGNARFSARASVGFAANLRAKLFEKVQGFSFGNIDTFSTSSLTIRLTNDITQMQQICTMGMRVMIRAPLMLPFALFMAIRINSQLALILGVAVPVMLVLFAILIVRAMPLFDRMQKAVDRLNRTVQENVTNVRVVKSFVRTDYEKEKFREVSGAQMDAAMRAMNAVIINLPALMLIMNGTIAAVVFFGGRQVIGGTLTVAEVTKFINYIMQILMSLMMFAMMFIMLSRASASYRRIMEVLRTETDMQDRAGAREAKDIRGKIEFRGVSFRYHAEENAQPVLSDVSLSVEPGEVVAVLGGTGAGKTSMVQLIPRLYDATEGQVLIDGVDVRDYTLESLRETVGMVLQKNTLFSGTIRENLRWGNEHATDEELMHAAKSAQAHDFISDFTNGYDTWIEQGGVNVSGGQKQRLCIARALLKKPAILILDDSTSAVDTATEKRLRESFRTDLTGTTILLITQRISSAQDADRIIVMDDGQIVGVGSHDELMGECQAYREIYQSQMREEESA